LETFVSVDDGWSAQCQNFQMEAPTGMGISTVFKEGKVKFSRVLSIQIRCEIGTGSGVTSRMVLPSGSSKGLSSFSRSWPGLRAMASGEGQNCLCLRAVNWARLVLIDEKLVVISGRD
jgi:hypothetical protein